MFLKTDSHLLNLNTFDLIEIRKGVLWDNEKHCPIKKKYSKINWKKFKFEKCEREYNYFDDRKTSIQPAVVIWWGKYPHQFLVESDEKAYVVFDAIKRFMAINNSDAIVSDDEILKYIKDNENVGKGKRSDQE